MTLAGSLSLVSLRKLRYAALLFLVADGKATAQEWQEMRQLRVLVKANQFEARQAVKQAA